MVGKPSKGIVSWFRKLRTSPAGPAAANAEPEREDEVKQLPALVRVLSLPPQSNLKTWVSANLSSSKRQLRRTISYDSPCDPLPLTAKNVAALNASQSFYSTGSKGQALHRCSDDWDAPSSSASSVQKKGNHGIELEDIRAIPEDAEVTGSSSSPAASQIPAHVLHTASTDHTAYEGSAGPCQPISHIIDHLTDAQPHGLSVSSNIHNLQHAVDMILQENAQLRSLNPGRQQHVADQDADDAADVHSSNIDKAMYHAMNAVCVDLVKLQLEVRAKDQAIQKLKLQISSVQKMLQV